jgi:DNA-binding CsgD family transcriptional regulator
VRNTPILDESRLLELVELTYDAGEDRGRWANILRALKDDFQCELVAFDVQDRETQSASVQCSVGPSDAALQREYESYYASRNVFLHARPDLTYTGAIRNGEAIVPDRDAMRSEYFNDFLRRIGVLHAVGLVPLREGSVMALLSLMRRIGAPSLCDHEHAFLRRDMPHHQPAIQFARRLRGIDHQRAAASEALDRLPYGVLVLDAAGTIMFANAAAEELLAMGDGLRTLAGRPSATAAADADTLRRLIDEACQRPGRLGANAGGFVPISRPSGRRPFALMVAPLRLDISSLSTRRPAAIVFVTDPDRVPPGLQAMLRRLYRLTPREADVAERLLAGRSVDEIGDDLGTSINTSRTHVKRILAKTGARSQADLVRLLLRVPTGLQAGGRRS